MSIAIIPNEWASLTNYSTGPDVGTATCVDPASAPNGFIRGVGAAAQHVNFVLNAHSLSLMRLMQVAALHQRYLPVAGAVAITDTAEFLTAVQRDESAPVVIAKTGQSWRTGDMGRLEVAGAPASITGSVADGATNGTRILIVGAGGNRCTYTDDDGTNWTAGADLGATVVRCVWNRSVGAFHSGTNLVLKTSTTGAAAWSSSAGTAFFANAGIGVLSNGHIIGLTATGTPAFSVSTDGGANVSSTGGTVADAANYDGAGSVAGNNGALVYHAGARLTGTKLRISSSTDGATWSTMADISRPAGCTFNTTLRMFVCPNSGMLMVAAVINSAGSADKLAYYASTDGTNWVGPALLVPSTASTTGTTVAGGRVFSTIDDMIFGSDGLWTV